MSDLDENLLLRLKLDEVDDQNGIVVVNDISGNNHNGTVHGAQLIPDDFFGSCLSFDGTDDYVDLPTTSIPSGNEITVSLWAYGAETLPVANSVISANKNSGNDRVLNIHFPWSDSRIYFDCGHSSGGFDRIDKVCDSTDFKGRWAHWVFTKNSASGEMKIYLDGALWHSANSKTRSLPEVTEVSLGSHISGGNRSHYYKGKIAHLRIYSKSISTNEQAKEIRDKDLTAQQIFKYTYPVDFNLSDDDEQNIFYISDDVAANQVQVTIKNTSGRILTFDALSSSAVATATNAHFELKFRPNTFVEQTLGGGNSNELEYPTVTAQTGWTVSPATKNSDSTVSLFLLKTQSLSLNADEQINFTLSYSSADGVLGARGTRVELVYNNLHYQGETEALQGSRLKQVDIVNQRGKKNIPLHIGIVGSNTVLNDAEPGNSGTGAQSTLRIRILNTLKVDDTNVEKNRIAFNTTGEASAQTKFTIAFDSFDDDRALGSSSEVEAITATSNNDYTINKTSQGLSTTFEITPTQSYLAPGAFMDIELTNVRSSKASGLANVYVRYEDIPGYWDGQFVCQAEKTPIVHQMLNGSRNVGIGTSPDADNQLKIGGKLKIESSLDANSSSWDYNAIITNTKPNQYSSLRIQSDSADSGDSAPAMLELIGRHNGSAHGRSGWIGVEGVDDHDRATVMKFKVRGRDNDGYKWSGSSEAPTRMVIDDEGRVGIGKSNPAAKLHVVQTGNDDSLRVDDYSGDSTPFVVRADGKVGVSQSIPKSTLHVNGDYYGKGHVWFHANEGDGNSGTAYIQARDDSSISNIGMMLRTKKGSSIKDVLSLDSDGNTLNKGCLYINSSSNAVIHYGNRGKLGQATSFDPDNNSNGLWIEGNNNGSECGGLFMNGNTMCLWSPGDNDTLRVYDEDNFSGGPVFVIDNYKKVGIGTADPAKELHVKGTSDQPGIRIEGNSNAWWDIKIEANDSGDQDLLFVYKDGTITDNWASLWIEPGGGSRSPSSEKLKKNIKPIQSVISKILKLNPVSFEWKETTDPKADTGFIAEDVELLFPDLVKEKNGIKSLNYDNFAVLAIAAIKEQQKFLENLRVDLNTLKT